MILLKNFIYFFSLLLIIGCNSNPLDVKVVNKDLKIRYVNLDSVFVYTNEYELVNTVNSLQINPKEILSYEVNHCLNIGDLKDSLSAKRIKLFVNDLFIKRVEKRINEKFSDLNKIKAEITKGFLHLNYHLPKNKLPKNIIFLNSFFASNVFCTENEIGIGLERYLGAKTDVIQELPSDDFFQWIKDKMDAKFLVRDVFAAWIMTHCVPEDNENIAAAIVNWGKIIYLTEASLPTIEKSILLRYSKKDFEWCEQNEFAFWKYLVEQKLLFSKNERDLANLLNDAPFTIGLPEKGPDRFGQFLGWKMVHNYLEKNPDTKLDDLIKINYTKILQEYEP